MAVRIVRLGSPRKPGEGLRLGTVRRPPRGVPKAEFAKRNFYDVWLPSLSPTEPLIQQVLGSRDLTPEKQQRAWRAFERKFRAAMKQPDTSRLLDLIAGLSHQTSLSLGCYCAEESRCHRSILRKLLEERGADIV